MGSVPEGRKEAYNPRCMSKNENNDNRDLHKA
jgi:hypothetical protein